MLKKEDLVNYFKEGCKKIEDASVGIEIEALVFKNYDTIPKRVSYEEKGGIKDLLNDFCSFGFKEVVEDDYVIGLYHPITKESISIEPGGQFELSGAPLKSLDAIEKEVNLHFDRLSVLESKYSINFLTVGADPYSFIDDIPWMPKERYKIMRDYMPKVGSLGLHMMKKTATVQVNLDYFSEEDMKKKMRVAYAIQPIVIAHFANSTQVDGKVTPYKGYRTHIWQNTDKDRCGILPFVFDADFSFETYVDYLLDVPMYFFKRHKKYIDVTGQSFKDFMQGKLKEYPAEMAT
jgi:glutamate--cysteine ligase